MATRRRKRSCKYGKLKRRVKTKSGRRRRCKKKKSRKSRKSRKRSCKYGKLKRKSGKRRCRKRKYKISFGDMIKTYGLKKIGIKSKTCKRRSKRSTKKGKSGSITEGSGSSSCIS